MFLFWERVGNKKHFFVSLRLPLFSPRYIKPKNNFQNIYLTNKKYIPHSPGNLPEIAFHEFKLTHSKTHQISEPSFVKGSRFKILNITAQI